MEGVTICRSSLAKGSSRDNEILRIDSGGRLDVFNCVFDNRGSIGNCVSIGTNAKARWERARISGGLFCDDSAKVSLNDCVLENNRLSPRMDKRVLAIAETNKRKRLDCTSSGPLAGSRRQ